MRVCNLQDLANSVGVVLDHLSSYSLDAEADGVDALDDSGMSVSVSVSLSVSVSVTVSVTVSYVCVCVCVCVCVSMECVY